MKHANGSRRARTWAGAGIVALTLLVVACGAGGGDTDEEDRPVSAPPRVTVEGGETVVRLDAETQAQSGLTVAVLQAATHQAVQTAYGNVLDLTDLAGARGTLTVAAAHVAKAQASLTASRAEFRRIEALHTDQRNASDKALEAATAAFRADEADARVAQAEVATLTTTARQRWGDVIAGWLARGSPRLDALLAQKERLVQLTLPPGASLSSPPPKATLRVAGDAAIEARLVSAAPRTDPRIQGESLFYAAPAAPSLLPGTSVAGTLSLGAPSPGVVVPASAVVWWRGKAWAYVEKAAGKFVRREVPTDAPLPDGFFAAKDLAAGERVVVQGGQLLLSEEGRAAVHGSEG